MEESNYSQMVEKYSNMIYRIAFSYMKNREDAEDVYQNVFLKLLTKKHFKDAEHDPEHLVGTDEEEGIFYGREGTVGEKFRIVCSE